VVGKGLEQNTIKLIDFGISTSFIKSPILWCEPKVTEDHINPGSTEFEGNIAFASSNCLNNRRRSRKDDLISVVYILLRLLSGELPYNGSCLTLEEYRRAKNNESPTELCTRQYPLLCDFSAEIDALDFNERPDYNHLRFILTRILLDFDASPVAEFRWPMGSDPHIADQYINPQVVVTDESQNEDEFHDTDELIGIMKRPSNSEEAIMDNPYMRTQPPKK
jgi:serine/threonine protein kinase